MLITKREEYDCYYRDTNKSEKMARKLLWENKKFLKAYSMTCIQAKIQTDRQNITHKMLRNSGVCQICKGDVLLVAGLTRAKCASRAPWVRKSGNLSMREILGVTSAYVRPSVRTYVHTDSGGGGRKSQGNPTGGG